MKFSGIALLLLALVSAAAHGAETEPRAAALIDGVKKEGSMVFYT